MSSIQQSTAHEWTPAKVEATKIELLRRAAKDHAFRQRCLDDAPAAIKEVSGLDLPEGAPRVRFVERVEEFVIVLPSLKDADKDLSDKDLELIAGGLAAQQEPDNSKSVPTWESVGMESGTNVLNAGSRRGT